MKALKFLGVFALFFTIAFVLATLLFAAIGTVLVWIGLWTWPTMISGALGCGTGTGLAIGIKQAMEDV